MAKKRYTLLSAKPDKGWFTLMTRKCLLRMEKTSEPIGENIELPLDIRRGLVVIDPKPGAAVRPSRDILNSSRK
jgi:hypothetical protein